MKKIKTITCLVVLSLIVLSFGLNPIKGEVPAEKKGEPKYYDRTGESIEKFEDLFFPHYFSTDLDRNITVADHWKKPQLLNEVDIGDGYTRFKQPPNYTEEDLPPDYKPAYFKLFYPNGTVFDSYSNTRINLGYGGMNKYDLTNTSTLRLKTAGELTVFYGSNRTWNQPFDRYQDISFIGGVRTYNLFGHTSTVHGINHDDNYIKVKIKSDVPIRAYVFEDNDGKLVDYDESRSRKITLEIRNDYNHWDVNHMPFLTIVSASERSKGVNASFIMEICDYPEPWWFWPAVIGGCSAIIAGAVIWFKKQY